jgi:hypothetical protein
MLSPNPESRAKAGQFDTSGWALIDIGLRHATRADLMLLVKALQHSEITFDSLQGPASSRALAIVVARAIRSAKAATNPILRAREHAALSRMREFLLTRLLNMPAGPSTGDADNLDETVAPLTVEASIARVYQLVVGRTPIPAEIDVWKNRIDCGLPFHEFLLSMDRGEEAQDHMAARRGNLDGTDGEYIQTVYELVVGRGATPREIEAWGNRLNETEMGRSQLLVELFQGAMIERNGMSMVHDGLSCTVMGTSTVIHLDDWTARAAALADVPSGSRNTRHRSRFQITGGRRCLVTAIASLYRGRDFIAQFMENITSQSIFDEFCELIIIDADSPEKEFEIIEPYLARHSNIKYLRMNYRIGIYDAWNVGVNAARGEYVTNANVDDMRRVDSFELQAATLDCLPFVDVVYQDFYYSFDSTLTFEQSAAFNYKSDLPIINLTNMLQFNSPHNAPMWRKRIHQELGTFDTRFKSAGDYEFWLRCLAAGKQFYKLNDPHVVYFQNPKGISTTAESAGRQEARSILNKYCRRLIPRNITMTFPEFCASEVPDFPIDADDGRRDKYRFVQAALRNAGRSAKHSGRGQSL